MLRIGPLRAVCPKYSSRPGQTGDTRLVCDRSPIEKTKKSTSRPLRGRPRAGLHSRPDNSGRPVLCSTNQFGRLQTESMPLSVSARIAHTWVSARLLPIEAAQRCQTRSAPAR